MKNGIMALVSALSIAAAFPGASRASGSGEASDRVSGWLGSFDEIREGLEENDGFIRSDDKMLLTLLFRPAEGESNIVDTYAMAGESTDDSLHARLSEKVSALWMEINRIATRVSPVKGDEADAIVRAAVSRRVTLGASHAKVVRTVLTGGPCA